MPNRPMHPVRTGTRLRPRHPNVDFVSGQGEHVECTHHDNQTRPSLCVFAKVLGAEGENARIANRLKEE